MILALMTARPYRVVMLGAPGSGKSTHAARLAERLGAAHLNLGSMFREVAAEDSPLGPADRGALVAAGKLVPDEIADQVIGERIEALPADRDFVLEGYPRSAAQAGALHRLLGRPRVARAAAGVRAARHDP